ncbi:MAG: zinc ribbon domain-containing protein [Deltaproteobacteria bacterium]|jgi:hypothetical protein|nr:zinc ribbon domain-containing protein [Deltaproteobacteria bacterium]
MARATVKKQDTAGASISCPVCGQSVRLPAENCPACGTNLRTGEKPEKETSVWQRRGFKPLVVSVAVVIPLISWLLGSGVLDDLDLITRARVGLQHCADPPARDMWEADDKAQEVQAARKGYDSWKSRSRTRPGGQSPSGPETEEERNMTREQRETRADRRNYFAASLMFDRPSADLKEANNWYGRFAGEWDAAWITGSGTPQERILQGEWNFTWINGGEAVQDILSVPYLWEPVKGVDPVRASSMRTFNSKADRWEGVHLQGGRIFPFTASRNSDGNIYESYQDGQLLVTWIFYNITQEGFQVTVNQTSDGGRTYALAAEIWAKRRIVEIQ